MNKIIVRHPMVQGFRLKIAIGLLKMHIFLVALLHLRSWRKTRSTVQKLREQIRKYRGPHSIQKVSFVNGRYYWDMYGEGWPTSNFVRNVKRECNRINAPSGGHVGMRNVLFGITTKCPLQCEHCYEWNNLNLKEKLSYRDLQDMIRKLIAYGVGQIHLSGGEPMMRYDDMLKLLEEFSGQVGFWMITSGFQVAPERAHAMKAAGLTGMCVSVDHHEENQHNQFRHHPQSFSMARQALIAASEAGLVTTMSLCATREFATPRNLELYADLAKELGASFIQLLEPRAVGHFEGKAVQLSVDQKSLLENFFHTLNRDPAYREYPIIIYHEYYRPTLGCRGAGQGSFYIDPLGEVHACPFCRDKAGNLVTDSVEHCVSNLWKKGCAMPTPSVLHQEKAVVMASGE